MSELDEWMRQQVEQHAYAGDPRNQGLFHRLVHGYLALRSLDASRATPGLHVFGAVVPKHGLATAPALAARARALIDAWIAASDPIQLADLAYRLTPEDCGEVGLRELPSPVCVADLEVDLDVEVTDLDESSPRYDQPVRDLAALAQFDRTSTSDVAIEHLPFADAFLELDSFTARLAFDAPRRRLVLRARFELVAIPDEAHGARLMQAIAAGTGDAEAWMHAAWSSPLLGEAVYAYHVIVGEKVLDARVVPRTPLDRS
jgi:hypothetical protein